MSIKGNSRISKSNFDFAFLTIMNKNNELQPEVFTQLSFIFTLKKIDLLMDIAFNLY